MTDNRDDVRDDVRDDIRDDIRNDVRYDVRDDVIDDVTDNEVTYLLRRTEGLESVQTYYLKPIIIMT